MKNAKQGRREAPLLRVIEAIIFSNPFHYSCCKLAADVVVGLEAGIGTEVEAAAYDVIPVALAEVVEVVAADAVLDESVEDTGIEVVAPHRWCSRE